MFDLNYIASLASNKDFYEFSATPNAEPCAQTGCFDYDACRMQKIEIDVFIEHIERNIGKPPKGFIKWEKRRNDHDFGVYYNLAIHWNEDEVDEEKWWNYINAIDAIDTWDRQDIQRLQDLGYATETILGEDRIWRNPTIN